MGRIAFRKMHGLGNDFVVVDSRQQEIAIGAAEARALANRDTGIGCDQVIVIEKPHHPMAHAFMRMRNSDGSEAEACGNGSRCVAALIANEISDRRVRLETIAGLLEGELLPDGRVAVDMGSPCTGWRDIPLAREMDTDYLPLTLGPLASPTCTSIGNPHATFFVADADAIDLAVLGPLLEHNPIFPARANIGVATIRDRTNIRLRVWERGTGITSACGSGACAALVAANRRGLADRNASVLLDGGSLDIYWREDGHLIMTGPVAFTFEGTFDTAVLAG